VRAAAVHHTDFPVNFMGISRLLNDRRGAGLLSLFLICTTREKRGGQQRHKRRKDPQQHFAMSIFHRRSQVVCPLSLTPVSLLCHFAQMRAAATGGYKKQAAASLFGVTPIAR